MAQNIFSIALFLLFSDLLLFSQISPEWVRHYNGSANSVDAGIVGAIDDSGYIFTGGTSSEVNNGRDLIIIKYNSSGSEQWSRHYNFLGNGNETMQHLVVDKLSNVYATGNVNNDYLTVKYNSAGTLKWARKYIGAGNSDDAAMSVGVDSHGNVYVTGYSEGNGTEYDIVTVKYDSLGNEMWVRRYNGPANRWDNAYSLAIDNFDNIYVTGDSENQTLWDAITIKYTPDGTQEWVRLYDNQNGGESGFKIITDLNGNVYIAGYKGDGGKNRDILTIKYNTLGQQQWTATYGSSSFDQATDIKVDNNGNVYVSGMVVQGSTNYVTIKYNSLGAQQWVQVYTGPVGGGVASSLALDSYGNVYVTGANRNQEHTDDIATVKYNNNGTQQWVHRYNGAANDDDGGSFVVIDTNDNVYVVGTSIESNNNPDITVIKYSYLTGQYSEINNLPYQYRLYQNFPNPFNPITKISYSVPGVSKISIKVYDVSGKLILILINGIKYAGNYTVEFDGSSLASGIYFYKIESDGFSDCKKMVLIK